jgi:peptidoglycan/xylan/chitin deacetylase (PgdA/CDA1 family)
MAMVTVMAAIQKRKRNGIIFIQRKFNYNKKIIMPVLMFHSIGCENTNWYRNWLSVSLDHFETFCKYLHQGKFETVFLDSWYNTGSESKLSKQVVLTFDDGYLDNWVLAYPILKKYNLKGTIFINPEFIDTSMEVRMNLDDVWDGKIKINELTQLGFLNWSELKVMESSVFIDIQSHSMSHNFYFKSNTIKDVYNGQPQYDWMAWNSNPEKKPYYITENQTNLVDFGTPIFDFGRALGLRRYFPDEKLIQYSIDSFSSMDFQKNKKALIDELNKKLKEFPGKHESDEEMERRYRFELFESKRIIEQKLNKKVDYLCWPGGGYNELSINLSIEAGYKASTGSARYKTNSEHYKRIRRIPMSSFISTSLKNYYVKNSDHLVKVFKSFEGNIYYRNLNRAKKLNKLIFEKIGLYKN